jgi:hypothetical protein
LRQFRRKKVDAGQIAARPSEARDKAHPDWIFGDREDDRDRRRRLGRSLRCGTSARGDHSDSPANQIGRQRRQPIDLIVGPAVFDSYVLALDKARVF